MNEEDDDLIGVDMADQSMPVPRMPGKNSRIDSAIWRDQSMNQRGANMPTTGFVPDFSYDAYTPAHPIDRPASAPRRPDFERIREHLVEDLDHAFTHDEKLGPVIAMPKAVAQALLNYLNWELQGGTTTRTPQHPGSVMQVLEQMQSWINIGPSLSETRNLQARMPRRMDPNMYPLIKLLDMLHEAGMLR